MKYEFIIFHCVGYLELISLHI